MIVYVDTSAAMKLLVEENESEALAAQLEEYRQSSETLATSLLLHCELHCAANRNPSEVDHGIVNEVLSTIDLVELESGDLLTAPLLPGRLRSADAIHLAAALRMGAQVVVSYDEELCSAATAAGVRALSPR